MIDIDLLIKCNKCNNVCKIENVYIDDKTSEDEFLIKEYICSNCNNKITKTEYINYILDKDVFI